MLQPMKRTQVVKCQHMNPMWHVESKHQCLFCFLIALQEHAYVGIGVAQGHAGAVSFFAQGLPELVGESYTFVRILYRRQENEIFAPFQDHPTAGKIRQCLLQRPLQEQWGHFLRAVADDHDLLLAVEHQTQLPGLLPQVAFLADSCIQQTLKEITFESLLYFVYRPFPHQDDCSHGSCTFHSHYAEFIGQALMGD